MSLEQEFFNALQDLVGGRVHALQFPQNPFTPITPAIVFTFISPEIFPNVCGDGGDATANQRTQVDVYSTTFDTVRALRLQVMERVAGMATPTLWAGGFSAPEPELKLFRESLDFISYPSSA